MKKVVKKNQIIITALAIMIAAAGYLNYSGKDVTLLGEETKSAMSKKNLNDTDLAGAKGNQDDALISAAVNDSVKKQEGTTAEKSANKDNPDQIGEAVLTSGQTVNSYVLKCQLQREQSRSKNKEMLMEIVNSKEATKQQKDKASKQILKLSTYMEKENAAEQLLSAKGFANAVVSMSEDSVDVLVSQPNLSEVDRTKIEDIVKRKTGASMDQISITSIKTKK